jgi:hypothetical protein
MLIGRPDKPGVVRSNIRSHFLGVGFLKHKLVEGLIGAIFGDTNDYAEKRVGWPRRDEAEAKIRAFARRGCTRTFDREWLRPAGGSGCPGC